MGSAVSRAGLGGRPSSRLGRRARAKWGYYEHLPPRGRRPPEAEVSGSTRPPVSKRDRYAGALWHDDPDLATAAVHPGPVPTTLAPLTGPLPWPRAVEKVKSHSRATHDWVNASLSAQSMPPLVWPLAPQSRGDGRSEARAPSYLTLEDGGRLLMTPTLMRGSFGKFRLGLWDAPGLPGGGQVVALKELRLAHWTHCVPDPQRQRRTHVTPTEAARAEISHQMAPYSPLPVHGVVEHRGKLYVSMPLLGDDLLGVYAKVADMDDDQKSLTHTLGLHVAHDGAAALAPMHAAGVIHRDVKPDNMIHGPGNRLSLGDLGMAARLDPGSGLVPGAMGTPGYAAPEVLRERSAGPAADTWSLMVTAVNVAVGEPLFPTDPRDPVGIESMNSYQRFHAGLRHDAEGRVELAEALARKHPRWSPILRELAGFDRDFADFVLNRGLNPDPARRADAAQVQEFFARLLSRRGIDPAGGAVSLQRAGESAPHAQPRAQLLALAEALAADRRPR